MIELMIGFAAAFVCSSVWACLERRQNRDTRKLRRDLDFMWKDRDKFQDANKELKARIIQMEDEITEYEDAL